MSLQVNSPDSFNWADIERVTGTNLNDGVTVLHLSNGDTKEVLTRNYQQWAWLFACPKPKAYNLFQLVTSYINGSFATEDKALQETKRSITGWRVVDGEVLPVVTGTRRQTVPSSKAYAVLNTSTGKVRIIGGDCNEQAEFKTLEDYQRAEALKHGVISF